MWNNLKLTRKHIIGATIVTAAAIVGVVNNVKKKKNNIIYSMKPHVFNDTHIVSLGGFVEKITDSGEYNISFTDDIKVIWYYFEKCNFSFQNQVYLKYESTDKVWIPREHSIVYLRTSHNLINESNDNIIHRGIVYK